MEIGGDKMTPGVYEYVWLQAVQDAQFWLFTIISFCILLVQQLCWYRISLNSFKYSLKMM